MTTTHDDKARDLLPCPFCGSTYIYTAEEKQEAPNEVMVTIGYTVGCDEMTGCGVSHFAETKNEAIAAWNRRAAPSPASTGQEANALEKLAGLLAGLEVGPALVNASPAALQQLGKAIATQANRAAPAQQVEAEIRDKALIDAIRWCHPGYQWKDSPVEIVAHLTNRLSAITNVRLHNAEQHGHAVQICDAMADTVGDDETHPLFPMMNVLMNAIGAWEDCHTSIDVAHSGSNPDPAPYCAFDGTCSCAKFHSDPTNCERKAERLAERNPAAGSNNGEKG